MVSGACFTGLVLYILFALSYYALIKAILSLYIDGGWRYRFQAGTRVVCLPVYLCPLHCPVNAPAPGCLAVAA